MAIIAGIAMAVYMGKKQGISANEILSLTPWVVIGGIIGARLFHIADHWSYYTGHPLQALAVQEGGLAIWGAVIGGAVAVIVYTRAKRLPLSLLLDVLTPALLVGQIIGRIGCTLNGDAWGGPTNLPWGFVYINPNDLIPSNLLGVSTHPYPIYEMVWNGLSLLLLLKVRSYFKINGLTFVSYLALYSLGRFTLTFVRQENILFIGLQEAQILALAGLAVSMLAMVYLLIKQDKLEHQPTRV